MIAGFAVESDKFARRKIAGGEFFYDHADLFFSDDQETEQERSENHRKRSDGDRFKPSAGEQETETEREERDAAVNAAGDEMTGSEREAGEHKARGNEEKVFEHACDTEGSNR